MQIDPSQILILTGEQLSRFATTIVDQTLDTIGFSPKQSSVNDEDYRYGLRAIEEMFNVSHSTAQTYKNTFLAPAIEQRGRKIRINVPLAHKLFNEHKATQQPSQR